LAQSENEDPAKLFKVQTVIGKLSRIFISATVPVQSKSCNTAVFGSVEIQFSQSSNTHHSKLCKSSMMWLVLPYSHRAEIGTAEEVFKGRTK
jgi:hypothetical protein